MVFNVLVVDDERDIRDLVQDILQDEGYIVQTAKNSDEAFAAVAEKLPDCIVLDIWLKDSILDGLGILETMQRKYAGVPVMMISGHGNVETAVKALRTGAYDYLEKPFKADRLLHSVRRAIESSKLRQENATLKQRQNPLNIMIGSSVAVQQLRQNIERVAPTNSRVFITGAAGSGKDVIARSIHDKSTRKSEPFIALNARSLSSDMLDHELFGTEESKEFNAPARKVGVFEQADGGTLFIDEITDIPLETQGKVVRFLQDKTFTRLGADASIEADVRVIAASSKNVNEAMEQGKLREDLFYRLNVVPLEVPHLKERREDIPLLCDYFLAHTAQVNRMPRRSFSEEAIVALQSYDWPGNIRELKNVMEWLLIMSQGGIQDAIKSEDLPKEIFSTVPNAVGTQVNTDIMAMKLRQAREMFEKQYLLAQISRFGGNISRTASFIGMERSALHRKLKYLEVNVKEETADA